jgi:hypothetical protein
MGLRSDNLTLLSLNAAAVSQVNGTGSGFDLSQYSALLLSSNFTVVTAGSIALTFFYSLDQGVTWLALPAAIVAVPASIAAAGQALYPVLSTAGNAPFFIFPGRIRVGYTITTGPVTGTVNVIGRQ